MALRGIDPSKYYRYIPEVEREEDNPTIFWVRSQRGKEINRWLAEYDAARIPGRKNRVKFEPKKLEVIDVEQFCSVVNKVENFNFFEKETGEHKVYEIIDEPGMIAEVARQLDPTVRQEVLSASQDMSRLEDEEKKA